ncbi:MAG: universal stress protein [Thermoplasmata archaeon]|nr:universal stress protein [Thermoplasmata archaeon]
MTPGTPVRVRRILAPVDRTEASRNAVRLAAQMARAFGAQLTLLHVVGLTEVPILMGESDTPAEVEQGQMVLAEALGWARIEGVEAEVKLGRGHVVDQILRLTARTHPDLIVMGTRGYRGTRAVLMGSVSRAVSNRAHASVVLVRAPVSGHRR